MAAAKKKKNVPTKISKNKMFKKKTKSFPKKRKEDSGVKESLPDGSKVEVFDIASTCNQDSFRKHKRVPMKDKGGKFKALRAVKFTFFFVVVNAAIVCVFVFFPVCILQLCPCL